MHMVQNPQKYELVNSPKGLPRYLMGTRATWGSFKPAKVAFMSCLQNIVGRMIGNCQYIYGWSVTKQWKTPTIQTNALWSFKHPIYSFLFYSLFIIYSVGFYHGGEFEL